MADQTPEGVVHQRMIPIKWPDNSAATPALYANNLLVQHDGNLAYLSFCQVNPQYFLGTAEERQKQLEQIESLPAVLVVKLVVPADSFRTMVEALQKQLAIIEEGKSHVDARITPTKS